ncbi:MAG: signal recognition particle-docking protein FtsY [Lentisphaerae bacterium GWF2_45_14]|nr:MAG: signal recognition particle-docking protein FtsY [Lentisphaerae bacterium GWF2_45_14]
MKSLFATFKKGLQKTSTTLNRSFQSIFSNIEKWTQEDYDKLEATLISADFGVNTSAKIVKDLKDKYELGEIKTGEDIIASAHNDICSILEKNLRPANLIENKLTVIMLVGVNGSGKTTTAGKLAQLWGSENKKVILAACDTFRAAAVEQLKLWGGRTSCQVVSSIPGADPSSVAFDAVQAALSRKADILIIDTAGRQHTKKGLMEELSKMKRTIDKVYPGAPHEVWLTIDASIGTNALTQAGEFGKASGVTGLIITKLDGTGKGGIAVAIQEAFKLPVFFVGLGEQPEDLQAFNPVFYAKAIFNEA